MSKKKQQNKQDDKEFRAQMRREIRQDMRSMFAKQTNIDKTKIVNKYVQKHSEGYREFIVNVVDT